MANRYNTYYRASWPASGVIGPVLTKAQLMNEIEVALLNLGNEKDVISINISKIEMTIEQFQKRPSDMKSYGYDEVMQ